MISKEQKKNIVKKYGASDTDTGAPEVQIGLLSAKIQYLSDHLAAHKKDHSSRRGLLRMVSLRRSLMSYLKRKSSTRYKKIVKELNLKS